MFETLDKTQTIALKVIGIGDCGGEAINHMMANGLRYAEFAVIDSNAQVFSRSQAPTHLHIEGIFLKKLCADERQININYKRIKELIGDVSLVFVIAEMGNELAPIVAQAARELKILTVAVVTQLSSPEETRTIKFNESIQVLLEHVDSLIIVPHSSSMEQPDHGTQKHVGAPHDLMMRAVACIAEGLSGQGGINLDYDEVSELLSHTGLGVVSTGLASGVDRASEASEQAIMQSGAAELSSARRVYVTITASMLQMQELDTVLRRIQSATEDSIFTISSPVFDEAMGDELRVTILATGINT